jgi:Uma2 family endonuclease
VARKKKTVATYADLVALPDNVIGEIIDGELFASPRPRVRHMRVAGQVHLRLAGPFDEGRDGPGGWWLMLETELKLGRQIIVPDISGWRRARVPELPDDLPLPIAPDWVCEVLSPSTGRIDREKKLPVYARHGVDHVWLVDPLLRTLEVFERHGRRWMLVVVHADDARVRVPPFEAVELDLSRWWMPLPRGAAEPVMPWPLAPRARRQGAPL